jgi:hypothetical protein
MQHQHFSNRGLTHRYYESSLDLGLSESCSPYQILSMSDLEASGTRVKQLVHAPLSNHAPRCLLHTHSRQSPLNMEPTHLVPDSRQTIKPPQLPQLSASVSHFEHTRAPHTQTFFVLFSVATLPHPQQQDCAESLFSSLGPTPTALASAPVEVARVGLSSSGFMNVLVSLEILLQHPPSWWHFSVHRTRRLMHGH